MNIKKIIVLTTLLSFIMVICPAAVNDATIDQLTAEELNETLTAAIMSGYATHVAQLIGHKKINVNYTRIQDQITPLYAAASHGHIAIVDMLINAHADVNKASIADGATPLHLAAFFNHPNIAQLLIDVHADPNALDSDGITPLHQAIKWKRADIIPLLLNAHRLKLIAPLSAAIKMIHAIEQQKQPHTIEQTACCMSNTNAHYATQSLPSIIEGLPIECLHIIMQNIPVSSLAHFRQSSKRCRVAAQHEYTQQLKNRIDTEKKYFEAIHASTLKRAKKQKNNHAIVELLEQLPRDLWQAAPDA